jgi:hypothetical protein
MNAPGKNVYAPAVVPLSSFKQGVGTHALTHFTDLSAEIVAIFGANRQLQPPVTLLVTC